MRIDSVRIEAFGPVVNSTLEFGPGFNIVLGPNESGKSSWHAATYAALCGMRRARGRHSDDQRFADRHKPWDSNQWLVVGVVSLQDGRRIELRQNLDDKVDSRAKDLVMGGDVSTEIVGEGSPDASIWLGMNRHTFLATACIRQADVLSIRDSADALQEHLQRAASTGGVDATAARALELLDVFQREEVGRDISNSTKPLRRALERLARARNSLRLAQEDHAQFLSRSQLADQRAAEADKASAARRLFEAALATNRAVDVHAALARASELTTRYSGKAAPDLASDDLLAQHAATAVRAFENRPPVLALGGLTAAQLASQIEQLPAQPEGDTKPHESVLRAKSAWDGVASALSVHDSQRPAEAAVPVTTESAEALRQLALAFQREEQQSALPPGGNWHAVGWALSVVGLISVIGGFASVLIGYVLAGAVVGVVGVAAAVGGAYLLLDRRSTVTKASNQIAAETLGPVATRLAELKLPPNPSQLLALADQQEAIERQRALGANWERGRRQLTEQWGTAAQNLLQALTGRGASVDGDLRGAYEQYDTESENRARQAAVAARRGDVQAQLQQRRLLETSAAAANNRRTEVEAELTAVAEVCGVANGTSETIVVGLTEWLARHSHQQVTNSVELAERAELQSLLGTGSIDDLAALANRLRSDAEQLASPFDNSSLSGVELGPNPESRLRELQQLETEAGGAAQRASGEIEELKARLHPVAPAEEEVAAADKEVSKLQDLDKTLQVTKQYLEAAQERVHRDIAPLLASTLSSWLPRITNGRYRQAIVNPETLAVQIRGENGKWREAGLVSDGTREQVYLLLRMALAQRLTKKGEVAPLLFDEVTVQSDADRTFSILELLHEMSGAGQVVLFSQEAEVESWARTHLTQPMDRLHVLDGAMVHV